ncbi:unnamed protein product [Porites evermanni]|uniref:Schlafen group 3-like DNA/RNA helicase domain-containing protein n=1 Tax=Porites evermanni TaxID=104178 RepID=A0ABN8MD87_9CNID|nr:unnamed protein product [Porites evermanni]
MAFPVVKGPGGKRYELLEGIKQNFLSLYGEWQNGTIMCPSLFPRDFISPVGDLPGVAPLKPLVHDTTRGDDAEEKIFDILKQFGEKENQPMFVLTKLKFTEFIKYCIPAGQTIELAEIDFAIVHLNIGVILVEVKATEKWPKRKAFNQLSEGEKIIKGLLHEDSHIPVYRVFSLTSILYGFLLPWFCVLLLAVATRVEKVHKKRILQTLCRPCVFTRELCPPLQYRHEAPPRYGAMYRGPSFGHHPVGGFYPSLAGIFPAQLCPPKNIVFSLRLRAVTLTADKAGLAELSEEIIFLNSEQLCIWECSNHHQLISGVSGSGKTILLQYKALECARKGEKVIICVPSPLNKKYEAFFEAKNISSGVIIYTFENFVPKSEEKCHLFIDELQILFAHDTTKRSYLMLLLEKQKSSDNWFCWFAYDDSQFMTSRTPLRFEEFEKTISRQQMSNSYYSAMTYIGIERLTQDQERFVKSHLKTVMRSTEQVFEFVKEFAHKNGIYSQILDSKQVYYDRKEDWQVIIGHRIGGLPVEEIETGSLETVATNIFSEVQQWTLKEIAVLVTDDWILEDLSSLCKLLGIPLCAIEEDKDALVFDHGGKSQSFEWPVVIAVCGSESEPYLRHLAFSRTVVKLVVFSVKRPLNQYNESDEEVLSYLNIKESILVKLFFSANLQKSEWLHMLCAHLGYFGPEKPCSFNEVVDNATKFNDKLTEEMDKELMFAKQNQIVSAAEFKGENGMYC